MEKYEIWRSFGKLDKNTREKIRVFIKNKLRNEGVEKPGSILIINEIIDSFQKNGHWDFIF